MWIIIGSLVVLVIITLCVVVYKKKNQGDSGKDSGEDSGDNSGDNNLDHVKPSPALDSTQLKYAVDIIQDYFKGVKKILPAEYERADLTVIKWLRRSDSQYIIMATAHVVKLKNGAPCVVRLKNVSCACNLDRRAEHPFVFTTFTTSEKDRARTVRLRIDSITHEHLVGKTIETALYDVQKIKGFAKLTKDSIRFPVTTPKTKDIPLNLLLGYSLGAIEAKYGGEVLLLPLTYGYPSDGAFDISVQPILKTYQEVYYPPWNIRLTFTYHPIANGVGVKDYRVKLVEVGVKGSGESAKQQANPLNVIRGVARIYGVMHLGRMNGFVPPSRLVKTTKENTLRAIKCFKETCDYILGTPITLIGYAWGGRNVIHIKFKCGDDVDYVSSKLKLKDDGVMTCTIGETLSGHLAKSKSNIEMTDDEIKLNATYTTLQALKSVERGGGTPYKSFIGRVISDAGYAPNVFNTLIAPRYKPSVSRIQGNYPMPYIFAIIASRLEPSWGNEAKFVPLSYAWQGGSTVHISFYKVDMSDEATAPQVENRYFRLKRYGDGKVRVMSIGEMGSGLLATTHQSIAVGRDEMRKVDRVKKDILRRT